jgi:GNAT superfamily N-acetyltransferase
MPTYTLRRATLDDAPVLVRHRIRMFADMNVLTEGDATSDRLAGDFREWLGKTMPAGDYVAWLIENTGAASTAPVEDRLVSGGGATLLPWPPGPRYHSGRLAFVYNVYTEPRYRGRGLARRVMEAIHAFCRDEHIDSLALNASEFGQPLYASLGYHVAHSPMMFLSLA